LPDIEHIPSPTLEQFQHAATLLEVRWPWMRDLHFPERFRGLQQIGVELVASYKSPGVMDGVMFQVPEWLETPEETFRWMGAFQFATHPEAHPAIAGLVLRKAMQVYPMLIGWGVTPAADKLQERMGWKAHPRVWRAVHPVNMRRMLEDYGDRLEKPAVRTAAKTAAFFYDLLAPLGERLLSLGVSVQKPVPAAGSRAALCGSYFELLGAGGVEVFETRGSARIVSAAAQGTIRSHAALWRELRRRKTKFAEMLLMSEESCRRARSLGYYPMRMTNRCWDREKKMPALFAALEHLEPGFLITDKVV
jgi:hypothetical protein